MPWSRRTERRLQEQARLIRVLLALHQEQTRQVNLELLREVMGPLAEALTRQDDLVVERTDRISNGLTSNQKELMDLMVELLNSVQPSPEEQIYQALGQ
jgi:hypothetical protein